MVFSRKFGCYFVYSRVHPYIQLAVQKIYQITLLATLLALAACSDYGKVYKSKDISLKYRWAMDLYEKKKWSKSMELLEQCKEGYRNQLDTLEKVYFKIAYANYHLKAYDFASMYFKDFTDNFGASPQAEEAAYMALLCDVKYVSDADLDQSQTKDIINALQTFINFYPESKYVELCNGHIDELRGKLHVKAYDQVKQYYGMSEFKNAAAAAKIVVKQYPDHPKKEELDYLIVDAQYRYAMNSLEAKRLERLELTLANAQDYFDANGKVGLHYNDVTEIKTKSQNEIKKLKELL